MAARLLALGTLVLATSACGAESVPSDEGTAPRSARIETVMRTSMGGDGAAHELRSSALVDYANNRRTSVDGSNGCRAITIGDHSYFEVPAGEGMPAGKHWVGNGAEEAPELDAEILFEQGLDQERTDDDTGVVLTTSHFFFSREEPSPGEYLDDVRDDAGEPQLVGQEDVRGERTTHYRATVDVRQRTKRQLEADGWKAANVERYLQQATEGTEVVDVWIGDDGLVRRVMTTTSHESGGATPFETVTTADYVEFDLETHIEAPPAAEVLEPEEWQRISEERSLEENQIVGEVGIEALPGAFEPSVEPSCLH